MTTKQPEPHADMKPFSPLAYGPVFADLFQPPRIMPLGPGRPNQAALPMLARLDRAFDHVQVVDRAMADCCRAAAWLLHDYHDQCHKICQDIATPSGSYWHAILHRREPDYDNAKYWFRRVGSHPVLARLAAEQEGNWDLEAKIPSLGASGAISGVMGGYVLLFPHKRVTAIVGRMLTEIPAWVAVGVWFLFQIVESLGYLGGERGGVAYAAHVGGFIAGCVLIFPMMVGRDPVASRQRAAGRYWH
jgi:hypothetical protein